MGRLEQHHIRTSTRQHLKHDEHVIGFNYAYPWEEARVSEDSRTGECRKRVKRNVKSNNWVNNRGTYEWDSNAVWFAFLANAAFVLCCQALCFSTNALCVLPTCIFPVTNPLSIKYSLLLLGFGT